MVDLDVTIEGPPIQDPETARELFLLILNEATRITGLVLAPSETMFLRCAFDGEIGVYIEAHDYVCFYAEGAYSDLDERQDRRRYPWVSDRARQEYEYAERRRRERDETAQRLKDGLKDYRK